MDIDEIKATIFKAARVRFPVLDRSQRLPDQIEVLIEYISALAIERGELEEAWLYANEALSIIRHDYDEITPDKDVLRGRTGKDGIKEAKKAAEPGIVADMDTAARLCEQAGRQVARLEQDYLAASRTYTLMTGGT